MHSGHTSVCQITASKKEQCAFILLPQALTIPAGRPLRRKATWETIRRLHIPRPPPSHPMP